MTLRHFDRIRFAYRSALLIGLAVLALILINPIRALADCGNIILPPPWFDKAPIIEPEYIIMDWYKVADFCANLGAARRDAWACEKLFDNRPVIVLPAVGTGDIDLECQQRLAHHEIGHVNGWPADHPDARF